MTQTVYARFDAGIHTLTLPNAQTELLPGVTWMTCEQVFTPAYWRSQAWMRGLDAGQSHRLGDTLAQEVAACLLGGHGIPAEVGLSAFRVLRDRGLLTGGASHEELEGALLAPLPVRGRTVRYRFARQKARYLHATLDRLHRGPPRADDARAFRAWFLDCPGVGYKTASWITRNWLGSDDVAIIDVHIQRAGQLIGLFHGALQPKRDYAEMERLFLLFAEHVGVRASVLDALIWADMRAAGPLVFELLHLRAHHGSAPSERVACASPSRSPLDPMRHPPVPTA